MKIAALTPFGCPPIYDSHAELRRQHLFDGYIPLFQDVGVEWNDWGNRLELLARAASKGYSWVAWIDADEKLEGVSRELIEQQIREATASGCVAVRYKVKEMWNEKQWRSDGMWNNKGRVCLQKNPLLDEFVHWRTNPTESRFHAFPIQIGDIMEVQDCAILHYGMSTPELRRARVEKWERLDPTHKWQPMGYQYMLDESGLKLETIPPGM